MKSKVEVFICNLKSDDLLYLKWGAEVSPIYPSHFPFLTHGYEKHGFESLWVEDSCYITRRPYPMPPTSVNQLPARSNDLYITVSWSSAWVAIVHFQFLTRIFPSKIHMFLNTSWTSSTYPPCQATLPPFTFNILYFLCKLVGFRGSLEFSYNIFVISTLA